MANPIGHCCICGALGPLSFEHVPPKSAFNDRGVLLADMKDYFDRQVEHPSQVRHRQSRKGFGRHSLCERCNNVTGAWYGTDYLSWVYQGFNYRTVLPEASSLLLPFHILPGRVFKQIITMFATAAGGHHFFEAHPELTRYVLNRDERSFPPNFRVYTYLIKRDSIGFRMAGITGLFKGTEENPLVGSMHAFSEISFVPFGYVLTIDTPPPDEGLTDITFFHEAGYRDFRSLHLKMAMRSVNGYFPGDYRSRDQWLDAIGPAPEKHK